jgi:hypothetical protein
MITGWPAITPIIYWLAITLSRQLILRHFR